MVAQQTSTGAGVAGVGPQSRASFPIPQPQRYPNSSKIFGLLFYLLQWHLLATAQVKADFLLLG